MSCTRTVSTRCMSVSGSLSVTPRQRRPEGILVEVAPYFEHLAQHTELCRVRNDRRILRVLWP